MNNTLIALSFLMLSTPSNGHEYLSFDELAKSFNWDFDNAEVTSETVAPGIHVLFGVGGNVVVSIGEQGVLMIDSQFPELIPRLEAKIEEFGGDGVDFLINTHWHFDHANGNPLLGRDGTWMASHINSRRMMVGAHPIDLVSLIYEQPPYSKEALPVITYNDQMQFHFNDETIELLHFGPAHTTGDTAVIFTDSNVVHMGDVYNAAGYPFIDAGNGGDISGMIFFCEQVLDKLNDASIVVPGHGPVLGFADLANYVAMLTTVRDRINSLIHAGHSLDDVIAAKPTAEFDDKYGDPTRLINRAYVSLSR